MADCALLPRRGTKATAVLVTVLLTAAYALVGTPARAGVIRAFTPRFLANERGDVIFAANTLVTCSLLFFFAFVNALVYVLRLFMNCRKYSAGIGLEHIFAFRITNFANYAAGNLLNIQVGFTFHLTCQNNLPGSYERFTCHFRRRVKREKIVN